MTLGGSDVVGVRWQRFLPRALGSTVLGLAVLTAGGCATPRDVISQLPTAIGGRSVSYDVQRGTGIFGDPSGAITLLASHGQPPETLRTAQAELFDPHLRIIALEAPGIDPHEFRDLLASGFETWTENVGGKVVTRMKRAADDPKLAGYLYAVDDTLIVIEAVASPEQAAEVLFKLP